MGNTSRRLESISLQCLVCGFLSVLEESLGTGWDFRVFGVGGKVKIQVGSLGPELSRVVPDSQFPTTPSVMHSYEGVTVVIACYE